jgi:hypothetical protein
MGGGSDIHQLLFVKVIRSRNLLNPSHFSPPPREKAGGRYAADLLLQLPAPGVRFRCKFLCLKLTWTCLIKS